jgi:hypothetical protein
MKTDGNHYDFIIVGAGPAAVTAAWPLLKSGKKVLMVDAGVAEIVPERQSNFLPLHNLRDGNHGNFFQGEDASKLLTKGFSSPKLRASGENFSQYLEFNKLDPNNFILTGLIGTGGLSRIWGAACSCYDDFDLCDSSVKYKDLLPSYIEVAKRIGMSGNNSSSIAGFIGNQLPLQGTLEQTPLIKKLLSSYGARKNCNGFLLGETLTAVTTKALGPRGACSGEMRCMWGCPHQSIYSAKSDIRQLLSFINFEFKQNVVVDNLIRSESNEWIVAGVQARSGEKEFFSGKKILLGMGTFATTRLVMKKFLPKEKTLRVLHNPAFSGAMLIPGFVGRQLPSRGYGGSQLCFKIPLSASDPREYAFGLIFDAASLPAFDLMKHMPFTRCGAINITKSLLPGLIILLVYMPPGLSDTYVSLGDDDRLKIQGNYNSSFPKSFAKCVSLTKSFFRKLGAYSLPGSFKPYSPGAEVHYGCSLSANGLISKDGELVTAKGIYVVDWSSLPTLTAKSHTLTIMANADRIARGLV